MIAGAGGDLAERLFERLVIALGGDDRPMTIGDIYQRLIPYRAIRSEIGVMELASYEHAFLRLLSGEGGHLEVGVESAAAEIRRELASPNPILGIYRDYPDVPVRLARVPDDSGSTSPNTSSRTSETPGPDVGPILSPSSPGSPALPDQSTGSTTVREDGGDEAATSEVELGPADPTASKPSAEVPSSSAPSPASIVCAGCESPLPELDGIRFCPFCGQVREPFPCDRCGTSIQPEWSYCIRCGAPTTP